MGDERRGGKEKGRRKETFLAGAEAQETHSGRRLQGVQVKIDGSPNSSHTASYGMARKKSPNPPRVLGNGTRWNF